MEISQSSVVRVRQGRWAVVDVTTFEHCRMLTLTGLGPTNRGVQRRILMPFDAVERIERRAALTRVSRRVWRRTCRALLAADTPPGGLGRARLANIDLYPHQLEPALAVVRGLGSRVLLADDVGLGKTIQAGLIVSELQALGAADRVLIITPAGLRDQWCHELSARLNIGAVVVDVQSVRRIAERIPIGLSPWQTTPVAITSVDYIKRPDVLAAAGACRWDVVIIDEAHGVTGDSDRHAAVVALAARAPYVVLLTATPHNGDRQQFAALCGIGATTAEELLVFRRSRQDVRLGPARRVRRLSVRPSVDEARMHKRLASFSRAIRQEHGARQRAHPGDSARSDVLLALSVLHKRALSSARALEQTVARRLATLSAREDAGGSQLTLPLGDLTGEMTRTDEAPEWSPGLSLRSEARERQLLRELADAAATAARHETKIHAIRRLIRRLREPAIVFTEYRDTLVHLQASLGVPCTVLHGGLTRDERKAAIEQFAHGTIRLLLATDAAGEGLNLQNACRVVINLELPWNPMRLEQRIGRVDRMGQRRTVHVLHLVARDTGEARLAVRLQARVAVAHAEVGGPNPLGAFAPVTAFGAPLDSERDIARLIISGETDEVYAEPPRPQLSGQIRIAALAPEAEAEAARIKNSRRYVRSSNDEALARIEYCGPSIAIARHWRTRRSLSGRMLALWRISAEDGAGRVVGSRLIPVTMAIPSGPRLSRRQVDQELGRLHVDLAACIERAATEWQERLTQVRRQWLGRRVAREQESYARPLMPGPTGHQGGLFDRRTERAGLAMLAAERERHRAGTERQVTLERSEAVSFRAPQLLLIMVP